MVTRSDKNLGPVVLDRSLYIQRVLEDHLLKKDKYSILTPVAAKEAFTSFVAAIQDFFEINSRYLPRKELNFLHNSLTVPDPYAYFYGTLKIHKLPATTRPIAAVSGSLLDGIGQWLDVQLQPLARHFQSYIRDSADLVTRWSRLENLPPTVRIFTMDAIGMYSNIDPEHCLMTLRGYLNNSHVSHELGLYSRRSAILHAIQILFKYNIFKFGNIIVHLTFNTLITLAYCKVPMVSFKGAEDKAEVNNLLANAR
jgi:hypothetical protein